MNNNICDVKERRDLVYIECDYFKYENNNIETFCYPIFSIFGDEYKKITKNVQHSPKKEIKVFYHDCLGKYPKFISSIGGTQRQIEFFSQKYTYRDEWCRTNDGWCLYVCGVRYIENYIFGKAFILPQDGHSIALVAVECINDFYQWLEDTYSIIGKVTAHEIGHIFMRSNYDCNNFQCIMYPDIIDPNFPQTKFCSNCSTQIANGKP